MKIVIILNLFFTIVLYSQNYKDSIFIKFDEKTDKISKINDSVFIISIYNNKYNSEKLKYNREMDSLNKIYDSFTFPEFNLPIMPRKYVQFVGRIRKHKNFNKIRYTSKDNISQLVLKKNSFVIRNIDNYQYIYKISYLNIDI